MYAPSLLGNQEAIAKILFPPRRVVTLETASTFCIMFFAVGVKQDSGRMIRPERNAPALGALAMFGTLVITVSFAILLRKYVHMEESLAHALPFFAACQCLTAFPNIGSSDLGHIAVSAALPCDVIGISLVAWVLGVLQSLEHPLESSMMVLSTFVFVLGLAFVVGPIICRIVRTIPSGRSLPERYVLLCFVGILLAGLGSEIIGQYFMLGTLVFGLKVPDGQPLGEPIISKLDYPISKLMYPTFLTTSGLKTNFLPVDPWYCVSKVVSVELMSYFFGIKPREAVVLGILLNARGIVNVSCTTC